MALLDPPDTADNVENTVRILGGGHGVLDCLAQHTSLYSPDHSTPLFYSPPCRAPRIPPGRAKSTGVGLLKWVPK